MWYAMGALITDHAFPAGPLLMNLDEAILGRIDDGDAQEAQHRSYCILLYLKKRGCDRQYNQVQVHTCNIDKLLCKSHAAKAHGPFVPCMAGRLADCGLVR